VSGDQDSYCDPNICYQINNMDTYLCDINECVT
jgi:hypothetical protein